jgi:hypothetical protein
VALLAYCAISNSHDLLLTADEPDEHRSLDGGWVSQGGLPGPSSRSQVGRVDQPDEGVRRGPGGPPHHGAAIP